MPPVIKPANSNVPQNLLKIIQSPIIRKLESSMNLFSEHLEFTANAETIGCLRISIDDLESHCKDLSINLQVFRVLLKNVKKSIEG